MKILGPDGRGAEENVEVPFIDQEVVRAEITRIVEEVLGDPPQPTPAVSLVIPPPAMLAGVKDRKGLIRAKVRDAWLEHRKLIRANGEDPDDGDVTHDIETDKTSGATRVTLKWTKRWGGGFGAEAD